MASWRAGGLQVSSRPHTSSVGQRICVSTAVASGRASRARICAANFCGVQRATIARIDSMRAASASRAGGTMSRTHTRPIAAHAPRGGEVEQRLPRARLALAVRAGRARLVAGVQQRQRTHARGGGAQDLQRHPPAHRVRRRARSAAAPARAPPAPWRAASRVRRSRARGSARARSGRASCPAQTAPIAQQAGQQQRGRRLRGGSPAAAGHSR